eukprot:c17548_g2_i1 orf=463-954(+)
MAMENCRLTTTTVQDFTGLIMKCRQEKNFAHALSLQDRIDEKELETHPSLGNHLVSMWVEVGSMRHARQVFDRLPYKDTCSWNSLIKGYVNFRESEHALTLYQKMQIDGSLQPDSHTFVALLKACATLRDLESGHRIYLDIAGKGLLESNLFIASTLVDMYAK